MSALPRRMQEGPTGMRGGMGRMQSLVPPLLHVRVDQEEQQMSFVSTGVVGTADGKMNGRRSRTATTTKTTRYAYVLSMNNVI